MNYDPVNYDVLFLVLGHRTEIDPSTLAATLGSALAPWYTAPFAPVSMMAAPQWVRRPLREMATGTATDEEREEGVGREYVASGGVLATLLPGQLFAPDNTDTPTEAQSQDPAWNAAHSGGASVSGPRYRYPFDTAWPLVTGIRWILQHRNLATKVASRRAATAALRTGALAELARSAGGRAVVSNIVAYSSRSGDPVFNLPFPSTPSLPGNEATYKSGAIFALFAGIAVGGVLLSAALKED